MGQPTPPGDMPLFEGLGTEWNDIVGALPEDRRAELAPRIKERFDNFAQQFEPLKPYSDLAKSGITPDHIGTALNVYTVLENKPREVYETLGQHLGLTAQQTKEVVEEINEGADQGDPHLTRLQQQVEILSQIILSQREQETQAQQAAEVDAQLEKEMGALKKKYGDVDEEEILMRMAHKGLSAEEAYKEHEAKVTAYRTKRPSPMLIGGGGTVPRRELDPTKLDNAQTKDLVTQMLQHAATERKS